MSRQSSSASTLAVCQSLEPRRLLSTIPINGGSGADVIVVEFMQAGAQRSVRWIKNDDVEFHEAVEFGPDDTIIVWGCGGDDVITVAFEDDYVQKNTGIDSENISIFINGGYGNDDFHIYGGPGASADNVGYMWVNGLDHEREIWGEEGDLGGVDTVYSFAPWGWIFFDDGDSSVAEEQPIDPVYIYDDAFSRWADVEWVVSGSDLDDEIFNLHNYAGRGGNPSYAQGTGGVVGGHSLDPLYLVTGDGDDTIRVSADYTHEDWIDNVTIDSGAGNDELDINLGVVEINGGDGDDIFNVHMDTGGEVHATLDGGDGDDVFNFGSALVPDLGGMFAAIQGGDGDNEIIFDDSDGQNWGTWNLGANQDKLYFFSESALVLTDATQQQGPASFINYANVEAQTLYMQEDDTPGAGTLQSEVQAILLIADLYLNPGNVHEEINIFSSNAQVYLYPSGGADDVEVGSVGNNSSVSVNFEMVSAPPAIGSLTLHHTATAVLNLGLGSALKMTSLTILSGGKLDMKDASAIIESGTFNTISGYLATGINLAGDFWTGNGISSSTAFELNELEGSVLYGLGVLFNNDTEFGGSGDPIYTSFGGHAISGGEILIKFTYMGDADLSGAIDGTDYALIDAGFINNLSGWVYGDFDYSGEIDGTDYALIDSAFINQTSPL